MGLLGIVILEGSLTVGLLLGMFRRFNDRSEVAWHGLKNQETNQK